MGTELSDNESQKYLGTDFQGRNKSKCKVPETGLCLRTSGNTREPTGRWLPPEGARPGWGSEKAWAGAVHLPLHPELRARQRRAAHRASGSWVSLPPAPLPPLFGWVEAGYPWLWLEQSNAIVVLSFPDNKNGIGSFFATCC